MTINLAGLTTGQGRASAISDCVRIAKGKSHYLKRAHQTFSVVLGSAWVTLDGKDICLKRGEEIHLVPGKSQAIVTPLGNRPLVYEIR